MAAGSGTSLPWDLEAEALKECRRLVTRLLHSPSLVAISLSIGVRAVPGEPWGTRHALWTACIHAFVIGWFKYRLGLLSVPLYYGFTWPVGIPTIFHTPVTVPLHSPNGRQMPAIRVVQGDCEIVYFVTVTAQPYRDLNVWMSERE